MAGPNSYVSGQKVRVKGVFAVASVNTDPASVTVTIKKPDGTVTGPAAATKDAIGQYSYVVDTAGYGDGICRYKFAGTDPAQAVDDAWFYVRALDY